ncbi:glycosyltransferase family 2 protein [Bacteroidota bacterium]
MFSVVIRNKNESKALDKTLSILTSIYKEDIDEIIIVDNYSTDDSLLIVKKYACKIVMIEEFSYGKATNLGIESSKNNYVLLLSSHAVPIGENFFKATIKAFNENTKVAGIRYIYNFENYMRAFDNNFEIKNPLKFGLMAACGVVNKKVWEEFKFDEKLIAIEDKEWSRRVSNKGYRILEVNQTFFYFLNRCKKSSLERFKRQTFTQSILEDEKFHSKLRIVVSFVKKILYTNQKIYFSTIKDDFLMFKTKLVINQELKKQKIN